MIARGAESNPSCFSLSPLDNLELTLCQRISVCQVSRQQLGSNEILHPPMSTLYPPPPPRHTGRSIPGARTRRRTLILLPTRLRTRTPRPCRLRRGPDPSGGAATDCTSPNPYIGSRIGMGTDRKRRRADVILCRSYALRRPRSRPPYLLLRRIPPRVLLARRRRANSLATVPSSAPSPAPSCITPTRTSAPRARGRAPHPRPCRHSRPSPRRRRASSHLAARADPRPRRARRR
ncbi:hypothetical protein C8R46DRAFT_1312219 [Mycena filopes]|nr:hypothetical protein C8R46DRAFT_1312219 [Mycena filopes]